MKIKGVDINHGDILINQFNSVYIVAIVTKKIISYNNVFDTEDLELGNWDDHLSTFGMKLKNKVLEKVESENLMRKCFYGVFGTTFKGS